MIFQQTAQRINPKIRVDQYGFTLIELLIVVVILSTLAAMVVPSFSNSVTESRNSAVIQNVKIVQSAIDRFHATQGFYPGPSNWGSACQGFNKSLNASYIGDFLRNRLILYTNADGDVCDSRTDRVGNEYPHGPYLRQRLPFNPVKKSNGVQVIAGESSSSDPRHGWRYNYNSGVFSAMTD